MNLINYKMKTAHIQPLPPERKKRKLKKHQTQAQKMSEIIGRKVAEPVLNKHEFDEHPKHLIDFTFERCVWFKRKGN